MSNCRWWEEPGLILSLLIIVELMHVTYSAVITDSLYFFEAFSLLRSYAKTYPALCIPHASGSNMLTVQR